MGKRDHVILEMTSQPYPALLTCLVLHLSGSNISHFQTVKKRGRKMGQTFVRYVLPSGHHADFN